MGLNVSAFTITVPDSTAPTAIISQDAMQADATTSNLVQFVVRFSEPIKISTFTKQDITLNKTTGLILQNPVPFPGTDNKEFLVTVTGMISGEAASLFFPAGRVSDLAGNSNTEATFTDNSVTYLCDNCVIVDKDVGGIEDAIDNCIDVVNPGQLPNVACKADDEICIPIQTKAKKIALICL